MESSRAFLNPRRQEGRRIHFAVVWISNECTMFNTSEGLAVDLHSNGGKQWPELCRADRALLPILWGKFYL